MTQTTTPFPPTQTESLTGWPNTKDKTNKQSREFIYNTKQIQQQLATFTGTGQ